MLSGPSPFARGKIILASALTALWEAVKAQRVVVAPGNGLNARQTPDGLHLTFTPTVGIVYATITTQCPAYSATAWAPGAGSLYQTTYNAAGIGTQQTLGGAAVPIYNPGNAPIVSGRRVRVVLIAGRWHVANEFCPAT